MWCGLLVHLPSKSETNSSNALPIESCPPAPFGHSQGLLDRLFDRLLDWMGEGFMRSGRHARREPASNDSRPPSGVTPLAIVRLEFASALDDIPTRAADELDIRIGRARSLRELWHLRADVFNVVSCHSNQNEARERLSRLNRHFPVRAPRSGFGGFDAIPQGRTKS